MLNFLFGWMTFDGCWHDWTKWSNPSKVSSISQKQTRVCKICNQEDLRYF